MKKPLTFAERARRLGESERLRYDACRELLEELAEVKDFAETYVEKDVAELIEGLTEAAEALTNLASGLGGTISESQAAQLSSCIEDIGDLPAGDDVQSLLDEIEALEEALEEVQQHRDSPGDYDQDEKSSARDEVRTHLEAVADALEALDPAPLKET